MTHRILAAAALAALCGTAAADDRPEPKFKGKPLAYWVERMEKAEKDEDQQAAARAVQAFGPDAAPAVPRLVAMLDDRSGQFRELVTYTLCEMGPVVKGAVPELTRQLKEKTARDPGRVIRVLGAVGPDAKAAVPELVAAVAEDAEQNYMAVYALVKIAPKAPEVIPALRQAAKKRDAKGERVLHVQVLPALQQFGPAVVPVLTELLDDEDANYLLAAVQTLGRLGPDAKAAGPKLADLLKHKRRRVRYEAAEALWRIETSAAGVPVLIRLLSEPVAKDEREERSVLRFNAIESVRLLGWIGPDAKAALPDLRKVLASGLVPGYGDGTSPPSAGNIEVREFAREAIQKIEGGDKPKP